MSRLTYERRESERRNAAILEDIKKREQSLQPQQPPKEEDFEDFNKYNEALIDYKVATKTQGIQQRYAQQAQQAKFQEDQRKKEIDWQYKKEKAVNEDPDFGRHEYNVTQTISRFNNRYLASAITESENAAQIVTHLGNIIQEAERIAALPPTSAIRELGKLEGRLTAKPVKKLTKAKPPITPGGTGGGAPKNLNTMSQEEYNIYMNKKYG